MSVTDPVEKVIADALDEMGAAYDAPCPETDLDFYVSSFGIWIECKRFHTPRTTEQMSRVKNIIVIQGMKAAEVFAALIRGVLK